ncbi:MAG: hypothetical protein CM1200mP3_12960 [Chloroflexota bacterium]|nr:MAG: hypothetical protein CM1200mP3_12960 [Chloroflexota bacterium]
MSTQTTDPVIVVVQLTGGNDYLNTVVPYADSKYWDYRPVVNVPEEEILSLNDNIGFHPAMKPIADMFKEGKVAIVHGVGYENSPRSHFRSMDIWHTCEPDTLGTEGWLGRAVKQLDPCQRKRCYGGKYGPVSIQSSSRSWGSRGHRRKSKQLWSAY